MRKWRRRGCKRKKRRKKKKSISLPLLHLLFRKSPPSKQSSNRSNRGSEDCWSKGRRSERESKSKERSRWFSNKPKMYLKPTPSSCKRTASMRPNFTLLKKRKRKRLITNKLSVEEN